MRALTKKEYIYFKRNFRRRTDKALPLTYENLLSFAQMCKDDNRISEYRRFKQLSTLVRKEMAKRKMKREIKMAEKYANE